MPYSLGPARKTRVNTSKKGHFSVAQGLGSRVRKPVMRKQLLSMFSILVLASACTSDPTPRPKNNPGMTADAGAMSDLDAGQVVDAGPSTEQTACGPVTPGVDICCPVDGKGCGDQTCFYTTGAINEPRCRDVAMATVGAEQACDANLNNCEAGYTCVNLDAQIGPVCLKTCRAGTNLDCATEQDAMGNAYSCLFTFPDNQAWGLCAPTPTECIPYDDMCPMGEHCEVISNQGQKGCVPDGPQQIGDPCDPMRACQKGGICVNLDGAAKCYEPCDPSNQMSCSSPTAKCGGELAIGENVGLGFGVCGESTCNPVSSATDCPMGQTCGLVGSALQCIPAGTATAGQACGNAAGECAQGNICINLSGGMGPQCYEVCDPMNPMCSSGVCQGLVGFDGWGICG